MVTILDRVVRISIIVKVRYEQGVKMVKVDIGGRMFQAQRMALKRPEVVVSVIFKQL